MRAIQKPEEGNSNGIIHRRSAAVFSRCAEHVELRSAPMAIRKEEGRGNELSREIISVFSVDIRGAHLSAARPIKSRSAAAARAVGERADVMSAS